MFDKAKFFFFTFLFPFVSISATSYSIKAERAQMLLEQFDAVVEQTLKDFNIPGLALGVVVDGQPVLVKGYGIRDIEQKTPVTTDTLFAIGSCTKAFTTFAMGMLMEEGKLYWDQPVVDILPEFRVWDQYATQSLTLRDLVTHRSGLPRHDFMWYNSLLSREEILKRLRYLEPACDIRERYNYNNLMYMTAGIAMERVSKKSWEEIIAEKILKPLEMKDTNFSIAEMEKASNYASPHFEKNDKLKRVPFRDFTSIAPGSSMNSNVNDMVHWLQMFLAEGVYNGKPLLSPAMIQEIEAPSVIVSGYPDNKEALLNAYGLGWYISSYRGRYHLRHDGGVDGFTAAISLLPQDGIGIIVLANKNLSNLPYHLSLELIDRILEVPSHGWLKEGLEQLQKNRKAANETKQNENLHRKKGTAPSHPLQEYIGDYEHPGYGTLRVEIKNNKLQVTFNRIISTLEHWHYDVFSIVEENEEVIVPREGMKFTFQNNVQGDVEALAIPFESGAPDIVFKKKPAEEISNLAYLKQFCGLYEIYNVIVEVTLRDGALAAIIPGQPVYELVPTGENEFNVKTMNNYSVRFVKDTQGAVEEVLLLLPYGAFSAQPVRKA
ncbi:MAG: serine hydrolase [Verrucomicrobiota bacterium]|nr:serine hydrolase [Verrucomicrobiota bacterium]